MKYLFLIGFIICSIQLTGQTTCGSPDLRLQTQSEVDNFKINYPGCDCINGILILSNVNGGPTDITALDSLHVLTKINQLVVSKNPLLQSFTGLDNIDFNSVTKISISGNTALTDISSLVSTAPLTIGGEIAIKDSPDLDDNDLSVLQNITTFGTALQLNNLGITHVNYLINLVHIARFLIINNNQNLTNLNGLSNLATLGGFQGSSLTIMDNPMLSDCDAICNVISTNNLAVNISGNLGDCSTLAQVHSNCFGAGFNGIYSGNGTTPLNTHVDITGKLYFQGDIGVAGEIFGISDERLKKDHTEISNSLALINQLQPLKYTFRAAENASLNLPKNLQYGLFAQDVEQVLPNLISEFEMHNGEQYKSVNYQGLISILVAAMQEQQDEIESLKESIDN